MSLFSDLCEKQAYARLNICAGASEPSLLACPKLKNLIFWLGCYKLNAFQVPVQYLVSSCFIF